MADQQGTLFDDDQDDQTSKHSAAKKKASKAKRKSAADPNQQSTKPIAAATSKPSITFDIAPAETKRLYLLDGMALLYRAHFALVRSPRFTSSGICTSGVFGMAGAVLDIIAKENPSHLAVCFDTSEPTERHQIFPAYKAQRDDMPEDLRIQQPLVDRFLQALHIPIIRCPGYEADDVIGTMAQQAAAAGFDTYMVTPDKDYDQLVGERVRIHKPGRKGGSPEVLGVDEVLAKWDIDRIDQVIDILGLMGDASDNIPGVPGIGPKTAQKLIAKFGSIEHLLGNTDQLKGKQRERIEQNADQARLSKRLVTIQLDVPHGVDLDTLARVQPDANALAAILGELEFDSLGKRLLGPKFSSATNRADVIRQRRESEIQDAAGIAETQKTIADVPHDYQIVSTKSQRERLIADLKQHKTIAFDTETTGLDPRTAEPIGLVFCYQPSQAFYVDCGPDLASAKHVLDDFRSLWDDPAIQWVGHHLKYDLTLLKWNGVTVRGTIFDTMLAHSMKEPEMKHGLDYLSQIYLGYKPISIETLIGPKGNDQKSMRDVPIADVCQYACEDADVTLQLATVLGPKLDEQAVTKVCTDVEFPLVQVLVDMEHEGIRLDVESLEKYSGVLAAEIDDLQKQIHDLAGSQFNIDSPKQLGVVLYEDLKVEENPKKTSTGQYTTRESELERLSSRHPIIPLILEYRNARKLKTVYVDTLPQAVHPETGHVHTHYSQTWTATGRMQSNDPNLQTIPIRKQRGRDIRAAFVASDEDHQILSADYSQIELRLMAELSEDPAMMTAFKEGHDIHTATAAKVYKIDDTAVTREMRSKAKTVNFGIIYGISAFGLQQRLNIPREEASDLIKNYFETYPGIQDYIDRTIAFAKQHGYVATRTGRRRYIRDINSSSKMVVSGAERLAMNSPIQGTAADILKIAMNKVHAALFEGGFQTKMVLTVHDEVVFNMLGSEEASVKPVIEAAMKDTIEMSVPIEIEMGVGQNWLQAH